MQMQEHLVAMCDVLGFSRMVQVLPLETLAQQYVDLLDTLYTARWKHVDDVVRTYQTMSEVTVHPNEFPRVAVFSDTVIIWMAIAPDMKPETALASTEQFFGAVALLIARGISHRMPVRAGVALGRCVIDPEREVYVGLPIVQAYRTEQAQEWVGGACHPSCLQYPPVERLFAGWHWPRWPPLVRYPVPVKRSTRPLDTPVAAINWPDSLLHIEDALTEQRDAASRPKDRRRWTNAIRFYRFQVANRPLGFGNT